MTENLRTYFCTPSEKKKHCGCDVDNQLTSLFFFVFPFCFLFVCDFFVRSYFLKVLFCFSSSLFFLVFPSSSSSCFYCCSFFCFSSYLSFLFFLLLFIFICFIFICFFFFLFFFLLINQKDRQERQTSLMIDEKHSNILVFLVLLMKQKKKTRQ